MPPMGQHQMMVDQWCAELQLIAVQQAHSFDVQGVLGCV
jgi:hypothetical protein